jgi:AraC-like DNA-binding protein
MDAVRHRGSRLAQRMISTFSDEPARVDDAAGEGRCHVAGWRAEPLQLGRGRSCARVTQGTAAMPSIAHLEAAHDMVLRITTLRGGVSLVIPDGGTAPIRVSGRNLTDGHFLALHRHEKAVLYLPARSSVYLVNLRLLEDPRAQVVIAIKSSSPFLRSASASAVQRTVQELNATLDSSHLAPAGSWVTLAIRALLTRSEPGAYARSSEARRAAVDRACQFVHAHPERALKLEDLCKAGGSRPRTLEYGFREFFDVTPMTYARCVRLDKVRWQLVRGVRASFSISAVARRWGFAHMGQFNAQYRLLFAETPSMTLARSFVHAAPTPRDHGGKAVRGAARR